MTERAPGSTPGSTYPFAIVLAVHSRRPPSQKLLKCESRRILLDIFECCDGGGDVYGKISVSTERARLWLSVALISLSIALELMAQLSLGKLIDQGCECSEEWSVHTLEVFP